MLVGRAISRLPSGYQEVTYIESNGNQYIDTGVYNQLNDEIEIKFNQTGGANLYGYRQSATVQNVAVSSSATTGGNMMLDYDDYRSSRYTPETYNGTTYIVKNGAKQRAVYYEDGSLKGEDTRLYDTDFTCAGTALICDIGGNPNYNTKYIGKVYYVKIVRDEVLHRHFIPAVRISDSVVGMYELVTGTFFTNQGTGNFTAGNNINNNSYQPLILGRMANRLPSAYQEVAYIESDGKQYIETSAKLSNITGKMSVIARYQQLTTSDLDWFGNSNASTGSLIWDISGNPYAPYMRWFSTGTGTNNYEQGHSVVDLLFTDTFHTLRLEENLDTVYAYVDDILIMTNVPPRVATINTGNIFVNRGRNTGSQKARWNLFEIQDNGVSIVKLVSCYRKSDNVAGMYDLVNNVFHTNAGTGTFTVGGDVNTNVLQLLLPFKVKGSECDYTFNYGQLLIDSAKYIDNGNEILII